MTELDVKVKYSRLYRSNFITFTLYKPQKLAQYSIGEAIKKMLNDSNWKSRYYESLVKEKWADIMGTIVDKYTDDVKLVGNRLFITTQVAPLKQELQMNKENIISKVNEYLKERVVSEVIIS